MNKKLLFKAIIMAAYFVPYSATAFNAPAEDSHYTMLTLAQIPECGIVDEGDGVYTLTQSITIPADCSFSIAGTKTLKLADGVTMRFEGFVDFNVTDDSRVLITRTDTDALPGGIELAYDSTTDDEVIFRNIDFYYASLKNTAIHGFEVDNCSFHEANGRLSSLGAITVGCDGASFRITNSSFVDNTVPAIGGAANYACGLYIDHCTFLNNNTANTNKPQLNLTVGGDQLIVISNCSVVGITNNNMVGGIAIGNLLTMPGDNIVCIENCHIAENRYGITGVGRMNMYIRDNVLVNNNHETNPMNGGSGISLAGYGYGLDAIISGNHIENSLWGITLINCRDVNMGQIDNPESPGNNVFVDNGNNGTPYDLYNNQAAAVYAQNNTWSVPEQTAELIETVIYHANDNGALGEVIFMPAHSNGLAQSALTGAGIAIEGHRVISSLPVTIYDVTGTEVISAAINPSIKNLAPGVYIARTQSEMMKFVK